VHDQCYPYGLDSKDGCDFGLYSNLVENCDDALSGFFNSVSRSNCHSDALVSCDAVHNFGTPGS